MNWKGSHFILLMLLYQHNKFRRDLESIQQKMRTRIMPEHQEFAVILWDGSERWFEVTDSFLDLGDQIPVIFTIFRDITERKKSEIELRKLSQAVEQSQVSVIITDVKGDIEYVNPKFLELTGYSKEEVIGKNPRILKSGFTPPEEYKNLWKVILSGSEWRGQFYNKKKNGEYYWESASLSPIKNELGVITHILAVKEDITERKRMEEALQEAADKFRFVFENAYDGISIFEETPIRENRRLIDCNKRYAEMAGRSREELLQIGITRDIAKTLSEDDHDSNMHDIVFSGSYSWIRPDGKDNVIEYTAVPIKIREKTITIGIDRDITERKRAEEALRESEERYRRLVDVSPDAVAVHANGKILYVNPAAVKLLHAHDEFELVGRPFLDIVHPDYKELVRRRVITAMEHGTAQPMEEEKFLCADGTTIDVEVVSVPTMFNGMPAIQVVVRNLTERKQAEESLKRERNLFRVLIDNLPDAIYVKDIECRKTIANVADVRNMGRQSESEVLGKTDFDFYPPDIAAGFYADDLSVIQSGKPILNKEEFFFDKDGKKDWLLTFKIPMKDEQGRIIGLVGIGRKITEQKRAMEALTLLSHTVKSIGESISITDLKNNILFVNEAFLNTYGYTEKEIIGKPIGIVTCDSNISDQMVLAETIKGGWQGERLNQKKDGTEFPVFLSTSIVYDEKEQPIGLVGVATDITERKQTDKALHESEERFRSLYENASIGIYRTTPEGRILMINPAALRMLNYNSTEELAGRNLEQIEFEPSYDRKKFREILEHEGLIKGLESTWTGRDGSTKYFRESAKAIHDENGKVLYYDGTLEDITDWKFAETELRESEERFRKLVEGAPAAVIILSSDGEIRYANSVTLKLFGYQETSNSYSLKMLDYVAPESREFVIERFRLYIQGVSVPDQYEIMGMRADGTLFPIHVAVSILRLGNEDVTLNFITDITERKRAEEALRESDEKLRNIVENSTNLFFSRNIDQVFTYLSPQARDIFDCEPDEALVSFTNFMADNPINKLGYDLAKKAVETGARQETYELELISKKGRRVWVEIQEAPVVKDGKTISIVGAATDITERRWAEMALQVSEKKYRDIVTWAPIGIYQSTTFWQTAYL